MNALISLWIFTLHSARVPRQKRRDYLNFASMRRYAYKQSTRKLSRSWLPTAKYTCPDERAPWLRGNQPLPGPRLPSPPSCLHPSVVPSPRQTSSRALTRQLGAKYDKLSRESPRVTASKNIYSPNAPVGRPTPPTVSLCRTRLC